MKTYAFVLSMACAASVASLTGVAAAADLVTKTHVRKHALPIAVTVHPSRRGLGGWGGWGWGYGAGQGLLAGALVAGGETAPYYDFEFGYPTSRRPYGYPYVAFPYGIGYPYYNISYGYYRPPRR
jgi:hypothetical protein